jgi:hypothetical protein
MPVSVQTVPPLAIARSICGNNMGLASVEPTAKQHVGPDHEPAIGLVSDLGLRGMIEAWFELERMKSNLVPGPDTARMLKRCEVRIRGAIMHLGSETVTESMAAADRSGGSEAVRALWMEAVAQGKAETAAALRSFHSFALSHRKLAHHANPGSDGRVDLADGLG